MRSVYTWQCVGVLVVTLNSAAVVKPALGAFHFMQIEQIIGGVNGDTTAQAIQLRTRSSGQNFVASTRLEARDATGANPVLLDDLNASVPNGQSGRRILITTPNFANYTNIPLVSDFTMDPIPVSYLAAGQVRFMNDAGTLVYWSVSWGGSSFTGSTTGTLDNDSNGNFGPPVDMALPSASLQSLLFDGGAGDPSTTNSADYILTAGAATFINNANTSFTLVAPDPPSADFDEDGDIDGNDFLAWQRGESPAPLSAADLELWQDQYVTEPLVANTVNIPEPWSITLLMCGLGLISARRRE